MSLTDWSFLYSGAVLSLAMGQNGEACYSGGLDGTVRCWKIPDLNVDPYDNYGEIGNTFDPPVQYRTKISQIVLLV